MSSSLGAISYSVIRVTILAAFTSALSLRYGRDPWPGSPLISRWRKAPFFSPVVIITVVPSAVEVVIPPFSVST